MKKILLLAGIAIISLTGFAQTVTNNFEDGNWLYYHNHCWGIGENNEYEYFTTKVTGNGFNGTSVCETDNLGHTNICRLESPWTNLTAGNITFDHAVPAFNGQRTLKVYIVNQANTETLLFTKVYANSTPISSIVANTATGVHKVRWVWTGNDGNSRGQLDNIVIPGTNVSDPAHNCGVYVPPTPTDDTDGDGVSNTEDDYPNDPYRAYTNYYPATGFGTVAFEDNWPSYGDYDMNDLVMGYRFKIISNAQRNVVEIFNTMVLRANGAGMENGFGYQLPNVKPLSIREVTGVGDQTGFNIGANGTETGNPDKASIIVFDKSHRYMPNWNTEKGVPPVADVQFDIYLEFMKDGVAGSAGTITFNELNIAKWNPFLIVNGDRGREVHLPDYAPTALADPSLFGTSDDDTRTGKSYKSDINLPWALDIYGKFDYPAEHMDINQAYLHFGAWVESSGADYKDWWSNTGTGYRDAAKIY